MLISDSLVMDGAHMTIGEQNVLTQNTAGRVPATEFQPGLSDYETDRSGFFYAL